MNQKKRFSIIHVNQMFEVLYGIREVLINNHTIYTVVREIKKKKGYAWIREKQSPCQLLYQENRVNQATHK